MKISIVYLTFRPGGYDMLVDSLKNQTVQDFELIVVDDYPFDRVEIVSKYLQANGIEAGFVGASKPKCFSETFYGFFNAWNTGLLACTGDLVVFMQDYTWFPPDTLERWLDREDMFNENYCISAIARYWKDEPDNVHKDFSQKISIWDKPWKGSPTQNGWTRPHMWIGKPFEMFYAAISYDFLVELNGFPECYDNDPGRFIVTDFPKVMRSHGGRIYTDREHVCEMINHKSWQPSSTWQFLKSKHLGGVAKIHLRENCFDLKTHRRGHIFWR